VNTITLFYLMLRASLLSTSGFGNLPVLHDDLIERGWAEEIDFARSLAIGQLTPGPNGLWVVSFAYLIHGLTGALLATLAIVIPPFVVLAVDRAYRRVKEHPAIEGFLYGLSVATVAIFAVVLAQVLRSAETGLLSYIILVAAFALGTIRRVPLIAIIIGAGIVGIVQE
jgi:chromate transporter